MNRTVDLQETCTNERFFLCSINPLWMRLNQECVAGSLSLRLSYVSGRRMSEHDRKEFLIHTKATDRDASINVISKVWLGASWSVILLKVDCKFLSTWEAFIPFFRQALRYRIDNRFCMTRIRSSYTHPILNLIRSILHLTFILSSSYVHLTFILYGGLWLGFK
jgi:hypothetical protein